MNDTQEPSSIPGMSADPASSSIPSWSAAQDSSIPLTMPETTAFQPFPLQSEQTYNSTVAVTEENLDVKVPLWVYIALGITVITFFAVGTLLFISLLQKPNQISPAQKQHVDQIHVSSPPPTVAVTPIPTLDPVLAALATYSQQTDLQTLENEANQTDLSGINDLLQKIKN